MSQVKPEIHLILTDYDDFLVQTHRFFVQAHDDLTALFRAESLSESKIEQAQLDIEDLERKLAVKHGLAITTCYVAFSMIASRYIPALSSSFMSRLEDIVDNLYHDPRPLYDDAAQYIGNIGTLPAPAVILTAVEYNHQKLKLEFTKNALGAGWCFRREHIVADKTPETFLDTLSRYGVRPENALMSGDSLRSDILAAREAGLHALRVKRDIPAHQTWSHHEVECPYSYIEVGSLSEAWNVMTDRFVFRAPATGPLKALLFGDQLRLEA